MASGQDYNMSSSDENDDDDFGQTLPPLHVYIKRILDKYPEGGQILKELLQNADDAGAKKVIFFYDKTYHSTEHLWSQSLSAFNGPALYVYNDATFKNSDWFNIQHPEQSGKHDDPTKVGRFGLGFISVYHLTDMPGIFSDKCVGFLDPHERYFTVDPVTKVREKGKRGKKWRISRKLLAPELRDQFAPFINPLFECDKENFKREKYPGTIFRFPLRMKNTESKMSRVVWDETRVDNLFQSFQDDAEISLLFLKSVESVSIYERARQDKDAKLIFEVEILQESRTKLRSQRKQFLKKCQKTATNATSQCEVKIRKRLKRPEHSRKLTTSDSSYIAVNLLKREGLSQTFCDLMKDKDLKQLPWVGVAVKTSPVSINASGRVFCFLPLPESESSHLPVHVHGYFGLGDNRRSIKWRDRESEHDNGARWNELLVDEVFPEAYTHLIQRAIENHLPPSTVYSFWPKVQNLVGAWKRGVKRLIIQLSANHVLHTQADGGSWKTPDDVYVDTQNNHLIQKIILRKGDNVVSLPLNVLEALLWAKVPIKEVTPSLMREIIRGDALDFLDREEKKRLLHYILKDSQFTGLNDVYLLPLRNGNFASFSSGGKTVYIATSEVPSNILPNMESSLLDENCPKILIKSQEVQKHTQLKNLTNSIVPSLLKECLPREWVRGKDIVTWTPGLKRQPHKDWLKEFWLWLQRVTISIHRFVSLPLIPLTSGNKVQLARLQVHALIFQNHTYFGKTNALSSCVCKFLESLGAVVVRDELPSYISQHREISTFIKAGNGEGVLHVLENLWTSTVPGYVQKSNANLKHDLIALFIQVPTLPPQWKSLIRQIPIFKTNVGDYASVQQCPKGIRKELHGIPVQRLRQRFILLDDDTETLAKKLEVKEETMETLLEKFVFPDIENDYYNQKESEAIMSWALERPHLDNLVEKVKFVRTSDESKKKPGKLFDPTNTLLRTLFKDQPMFPTNIYATDRLLSHLKRIGLRDESTLSDQEICTVVCEVSETSERERSIALFKYLGKYPQKLSSTRTVTYKGKNKSLETVLKSIRWVASEGSRPSSYPPSLPWYGTTNALYRLDEVLPLENAFLVGSEVPLVRDKICPKKFSTFFGWECGVTSVSFLNSILAHLKNVSTSEYHGQDLQNVYLIISTIYDFLDKVPKDFLEPFFSKGGIMENSKWVWNGRGFTTPDKIAFNSAFQKKTLSSYLHVVPSTLHKFKRLLIDLGVRESFTINDYMNVLITVRESSAGNPLSAHDMSIVHDTIESILTFDDLKRIQSQILVPDTDCILRTIDEVTYNDTEWDDSSQDFIYTHHSITRRQAKQLGVRTQRDVRLDQCSTDHGFELPFGQREKLTTRLRGILREYSHKPDVLKELLQNADDAGASEIHVVYDPRRHKGTRISGHEWKPIHRSPAICVYNDKSFTDDDIEGIQNVGIGGKISDATTIGRFGIGFNAVYHLTDCPTFLTQNRKILCVFDPHVKYVPRATAGRPGKLYCQQRNDGYQVTFPDMIEGYLQEYKEFNLKKGTMFRFPLRSPRTKSEISDECYRTEDVNALLSDFEAISREALLFLNNVQKISISEIDLQTGKLGLKYCVTASISAANKKRRSELDEHFKSYKDVETTEVPQFNRVYALQLSDSNKKHEKWLVSQTIGFDHGEKLLSKHCKVKEFMTKAFLPRGGAATLVDNELQCGKAFCFLPLQISTNLPIHVNGTFVLDQSRRNLKKGDNEDNTDTIHQWNRTLAEHVIAPAYAFLIQEAGRELFKSKSNLSISNGRWRCHQYDKLFPVKLSYLYDVWHLLAKATLRYIGENNIPVLPIVRENESGSPSSVTWCSPDHVKSNAYFDNLPEDSSSRDDETKSHILRTFLQRTGFKLFSSSTNICKAFKEVGIKAEFFSPESCLHHIRMTEGITKSLPCDISKSVFRSSAHLKIVLEYCLRAMHEVTDFEGLPFQLNGSDILDVFMNDNPKYITHDYDILPRRQKLFIHRDIIDTLSNWLKNEQRLCEAYKEGFVKNFTIYELAKHIDTELPLNWKGSKQHVVWKPKSSKHPDANWLKMLWDFISRHCKDPSELRALEDWPILPTTSGSLVSIVMAKTILFLEEYTDTRERRKVSSVLRKLGCPVISIGSMTVRKQSNAVYANLFKILGIYLATPISHVDVLQVIKFIMNSKNTVFSGKLSSVECNTLLSYFQEACRLLSRDDIMHLKQLPLFPLAKSNRRVSIHEFSRCHTYQVKMDIPDIDLDLLMKNAGYVLIDYNVAFGLLYEVLEITPLGVIAIYMTCILPHFHQLRSTNRISHIEFIRDKVLPLASKEEHQKLFDILREIKFIREIDGDLHEAAFFYDYKNRVFRDMIEPRLLLPRMFRTNKWRDLLVNIGLQHVVSRYMFIKFAKEVESASETVTGREQLTRKSMILSEELKHNINLHDPPTLAQISAIRFLPTVFIDDVRQEICPQYFHTKRRDTNDFICFQGGVPEEYSDLVWSVSPLIPSMAVPNKGIIDQNLGIESKPVLEKVLKHISNICDRMAKQNAYDKEDSIKKEVRAELAKIVSKFMDYLTKNLSDKDEIVKSLEQIPICLVDNGVVLVRANQLVFDMPKATEDIFKPYLYRAPRQLGQYDKLLRVLGAQEEPTFDQLASILKAVKHICKDKEMHINEKNKVHAATSSLFRLLQATDGKCRIGVSELYLPTPENKLRLSTDLHYTDLDEVESSELPSSSDTEFVFPLKQLLSQAEIYRSSASNAETGLIELLPMHLRPQKINTHEKPLETNITCSGAFGSCCPLVSHIHAIFDSDDLQEILLRLIQHQTKQVPNTEQKNTIANLRQFDKFLCVQELKTGFFDSNGKLLGERKITHDVFLSQHNGKNFVLNFAHSDIWEHSEGGSMFFLPLAQSINRISESNLDAVHIQYLREVIPLPSMFEKNRFLARNGVPEYDNVNEDLNTTSGRPGSIVPRDIWCLLDDDMSNKFHPGDIAVYKRPIHDDSFPNADERGGHFCYVFAKIMKRLDMENTESESASLLRRYEIDIGENDPIVVSIVELFMFRRQNEIFHPSEEMETKVMQYSSEEPAPKRRRLSSYKREHTQKQSNIKEAKAKIRRDVKEAMKLPEKERKECFRRLYRMWHPDKNPHQVDLATEAFQFLQNEIRRCSEESCDENFSTWKDDIKRDKEEEQRYRQEFSRHYPKTSYKQSTGSQFFPHSFTKQRPDPRNAQLWYRQAEEDFKTAQEHHKKKIESSRAWAALMIQQAVEKALKAAIFHFGGNLYMSHNLYHLVSIVCQNSHANGQEQNLRCFVNQLVELGCDAIKPRYPENGSNRTTGETYKDFKTSQALKVCKSVLEMVREILGKRVL